MSSEQESAQSAAEKVLGGATKGIPFINVGTEKSCCFLHMSDFLLRCFKEYPALHTAVEEAYQCAKAGYYAAGILVFSQLLKVFAKKTPSARNVVAHSFLVSQPNQRSFDAVVSQAKSATHERYLAELKKAGNAEEYHRRLLEKWAETFPHYLQDDTDRAR